MHVALVVECYTRAGGQERACVGYAEQLAARHRLSIVTASLEAELPANAELVPVHGRGGPAVWRFQRFVWSAGRAARRRGADIIHGIGANCPNADVVHIQTINREKYRLLGPPRGVRQGRLAALAGDLYLGRVLAAEQRTFGRRGPLYVAVSRRVAREAQRHYGVSDEDLVVLPNGFDPSEFGLEAARRARPDARRRLGLEPQQHALLFVGPDHERKGLGVLLDALAGLRHDFVLLVAGGPEPSQADYRRRAERLGLADRVYFLPHQSRMLERYAAADLLVLPTRYDPFGMVVVEAMACGVPVLVSACAGVSEFLAPALELLHDPLDTAELRRGLERLLDDVPRQRQLRETGLELVADFGWPALAPRLEEIWLEARRRRGIS